MMSCYLRTTRCRDGVNCCANMYIKLPLMTKITEESMICLSQMYRFALIQSRVKSLDFFFYYCQRFLLGLLSHFVKKRN